MTLTGYVPLMLVAIFALTAPFGLRYRRAVRLAVIAGLALLFARYVSWRIPVTVLPASSFDLQGLWVWTLFLVELMVWIDSALLFAGFARRTDRSPEADAHEARLRALQPAQLPSVDVFIATYNEPIEVLERTIVGATALDWPADRLKIWVLDDGGRAWLRRFCRDKGVGYLTRPDNRHAKAGNINAALKRTSGELFAIFDADFIPQRNFLYRTAGFFDDPRIGIVQAPHAFFNHDPLQANLAMRNVLPGDQRLFFDEIMPGRDGWDCAFCCGSNSLTRRAAIEAIGGALPTGSITEDMLLTLALLRKGYVTRYLNERLAIGLAPESLEALFVQRARWARGAIQALFLREGPFGPGLTPMQRLMFFPTYWISHTLAQVFGLCAPVVYLLSGLLPLVNVTGEAVIYYQLPFILGTVSTLRFFAPGQYFPLPAMVLGVLQSFRLLPTVIGTLVRPHGHVFKVTPKGRDAAGRGYDRFTVALGLALLFGTAGGFALNANFETRVVENIELMPIVAMWAAFNAIVLMLALTAAVQAPALRAEERFAIAEPALIFAGGRAIRAETRDISLGGLRVVLAEALCLAKGKWVSVRLAEVGELPARVVRGRGRELALALHLPPSERRDRLIRKIFTRGLDNATKNDDAWVVTLAMLRSVFFVPPVPPPAAAPPAEPPPALLAAIAAREADVARWLADADPGRGRAERAAGDGG